MPRCHHQASLGLLDAPARRGGAWTKSCGYAPPLAALNEDLRRQGAGAPISAGAEIYCCKKALFGAAGRAGGACGFHAGSKPGGATFWDFGERESQKVHVNFRLHPAIWCITI